MRKTRSQLKSPEHPVKASSAPAPKRKYIVKLLLAPSQLRRLLLSKQSHRHTLLPLLDRKSDPQLQFQSGLEKSLLEKMNCPICLETPIRPTLTECGHIFCLHCAEESLRHKASCALCRTTLVFEEFFPSKLLQGLLSRKIEQWSNEEALACYRRRLATFQEHEEKRKLSSQLQVGDLVDYWRDRKWREGKVLSSSSGCVETVHTIQPFRESAFSQVTTYDFNAKSRLLASHRTYTREPEGPFLNRLTQFRIEIFDFRDNLEQSLLLSLMEGGQRMEVSVREHERNEDSLMRLALSFQRRSTR